MLKGHRHIFSIFNLLLSLIIFYFLIGIHNLNAVFEFQSAHKRFLLKMCLMPCFLKYFLIFLFTSNEYNNFYYNKFIFCNPICYVGQLLSHLILVSSCMLPSTIIKRFRLQGTVSVTD